MPTSLDPKGRTVLALDESLDLTNASGLAGTLLAARGKDLMIDASKVNHLGAQCGQLLLSAKKTWSGDGKSLRLGNASAEFTEGLRLLGLTSLLPVEEKLQ